ncbi:MAG: hypothetical protein FJZ92_05610 [Chloroflexi bacterium]|nr:hypothetical protein [Chloroflexota bacterium]
MAIELHNPTAPEPAAQDGLQEMPELRESVVAVLENGKQHAKLILEEIAKELGTRHGVIHSMTRHKPVSTPADPAILDELAQSADWVLLGSAD